MKTITATTKYGGNAKLNRNGFRLNLTANDLSDIQVEQLASVGLASLAYRAGAGAINKALKVESNSQASWNQADAAIVEATLAEFAADMGKNDPVPGGFDLTVKATEHIHGTTTIYKFSDEKKAYARNAAKLDKLAERVGYEGEVGDGTEAGAPLDFLMAIKVWTDEQLAKLNV